MTSTTFKLQRARMFAEGPQPWRQAVPANANPIPSMIGDDEMRYLEWLCHVYYRGDGALLDLGPLAGGSTTSMARGLAGNPQVGSKLERIHSYDLWQFCAGWEPFFPARHLEIGQDLQPIVMQNLAPHSHLIQPHQGDICSQRWRGDPIEILFVDLAKTPGIMRHLFQQLFPCMIPGRTVVLHQDWVCAECPWIHLTMGRLAEHFEYLDSPDGGTVSFLYSKEIPFSRFACDPIEDMTDREADIIFDRAVAALRSWYRLDVHLARAHWFALHGKLARAQAVVNEVLADADYQPCVDYDVNLVRRAMANRT